MTKKTWDFIQIAKFSVENSLKIQIIKMACTNFRLIFSYKINVHLKPKALT